MVEEAEQYAEEDKKIKERIDARNGAEGYAYNLKNQVSDKDKLGEKIEEDDKETIEKAAQELLDWLDENPEADKAEIDEHRQELEGIANPIIQKLYAAGAGADGEAEDDEEED